MKVLNLRCGHGHGFEGWFASEDDFQQQRSRGLVQCPLCSDAEVDKLPSAPRLNLSGARAPDHHRPADPREAAGAARPGTASAAAGSPRAAGALVGAPGGAVAAASAAGGDAQRKPDAERPSSDQMAELHAQWLQAVKQVLDNTEDVGERFTEEARRIHYGETEQRGIRGMATPEQRAELAEEGVEVMALPIPAALRGPLQ